MITEDYVSFEVAKLLKENGFDECCSAFITPNVNFALEEERVFNHLLSDNEYSAPTLQQAMKWLRENHNLHVDSSIYIDTDGDAEHEYDYTYWDWTIFNSKSGRMVAEPEIGCGRYNTYEQACDAAIKYCLTNLI